MYAHAFLLSFFVTVENKRLINPTPKRKVARWNRAGGTTPKCYHSALAYRRAAFATDAQLNEEQTQALVRSAEACELAVSSIDQRAKKIIDARRQHFQKTGVVLPPSELLEALEAERNRTILFYRDQLGASLGEKEWTRFRGFVQERVVPNITTTGSSHNSRQERSQAN